MTHRRPPGKVQQRFPEVCTQREESFAVGIAHGLPGPRAHERAGYDGTATSRRANASRLLRLPRVAARVAELRAARNARLAADGEEELEQCWDLMQITARDFYDNAGQPIPIHKLPLRVAAAVKSVRPTRYGRVVECYDKMRAIEIRLRAFGRLVERHELDVSLEEIVARANSIESSTVVKELWPGTTE